MKMAFGISFGLAIVPNGRCLIKGQRPDDKRSSIICTLSNEPRSLFSNSLYLISASASMTTSKIFLFAPLTISATTPLTGDVNLIDSLFLSKKQYHQLEHSPRP